MADRPECDVDVFDLFVIDGETGDLRTAEPWERTIPSTASATGADLVEPEETDAPPPVTPTSPMHMGPGPGQRPAVRPRPIGTHEIFHPVLVSPMTAQALMLDGAPLHGIDALEVDHSGRKVRDATMTWPVRVDTGWIGGRYTAELCVRPSPSWVLTVVELRPRRHRRLRSRRFLRTGIGIVEEMCDRMLAAADPGG
ncbi:MAG: hypothetical protein AAGA90_19840 [Actinomycetota bacterium]